MAKCVTSATLQCLEEDVASAEAQDRAAGSWKDSGHRYGDGHHHQEVRGKGNLGERVKLTMLSICMITPYSKNTFITDNREMVPLPSCAECRVTSFEVQETHEPREGQRSPHSDGPNETRSQQ